jgi:hypothetical protein
MLVMKGLSTTQNIQLISNQLSTITLLQRSSQDVTSMVFWREQTKKRIGCCAAAPTALSSAPSHTWLTLSRSLAFPRHKSQVLDALKDNKRPC